MADACGHPVIDLCYPSGRFNAVAIAAVGRAGYGTAITQLPGIVLAWSNRLALPPVRMGGGETLTAFAANLDQPEPAEQPVVPTPELSPRSGSLNLPAPAQAGSEEEITRTVPS